ncbi:hypothetical protein Pelo_16541 [Pelomyxa schiedti]|nr:hypothetical protein Pelo_16541 [Pelomyxa schiedti]
MSYSLLPEENETTNSDELNCDTILFPSEFGRATALEPFSGNSMQHHSRSAAIAPLSMKLLEPSLLVTAMAVIPRRIEDSTTTGAISLNTHNDLELNVTSASITKNAEFGCVFRLDKITTSSFGEDLLKKSALMW